MKSSLTTLFFGSLAVGARAGTLNLSILSMNDHHSQLEESTYDVSVTDATAELTTGAKVNVAVGGFPMTVAAMKAVQTAEETASRFVIKLHAGDAITGGSYYSLFRGLADAAMMSHACFDAMAIGNHEFDDGDANLATFIDNMQNATLCASGTKVLSANVVAGAASPLLNKYAKSHTFTIGGEKVGVVGVTIKKKTEQSSFPDEGTSVSEEKAATQAEIDALVSEGVDKIILLTHVNYDLDKTWMAKLKNVDVVVGGDAHALLGAAADLSGVASKTEGAFPTELVNGSDKKVCVVQSWWGSKTFGKLRVDFDVNGDVTTCAGKPQFAYDSTSFKNATAPNVAFTSAQTAAMVSYLDTLENWHGTVPDAPARAALKTYKDQVAQLKTISIATVPEVICFERIPGQGRSTLCPVNASYEHGGAACQLVAKGFLHRTKSADIAVQNAGGCRVDIAKGQFSVDSAYTMLPFSNTIVTLKMTGAQIIALMEDAISSSHDGEDPSTGAYPYVAGLRMDVDASKAKGARVSNVEINRRLDTTWVAIDASVEYTVATNNYIAAGKDGYLTFTNVSASITDTYLEYAQTMIDYSRETATLLKPDTAEMTTKSYVAEDGTKHTPPPPPPSPASTSGSVRIGNAVSLLAFFVAFAVAA
jgi:5'-nucleotidase